MKKLTTSILAGLTMLCATSCLGSNQMFNGLNDWNQEATGNRWANELIFLGLNIIPVYGIAYLADIVIFNSIEWWSGDEAAE